MAKVDRNTMLMLAIFIGAIITVVFLMGIADQINEGTTIYTATNVTHTMPTGSGTTLILEGKRNTTEIVIINATGNVTPVGMADFNVTTIEDGGSIQLTITGDGTHGGETVNITYGYEPLGYLSTSSSRNIFVTVGIIAALAIVVFIIVMIFKGPLAQLIKNF